MRDPDCHVHHHLEADGRCSCTPEPTSKALWGCKIGEVDRAKLPHGSDAPLRRAVQAAYVELTGELPKFLFSGWGEQLTEVERDVADCTCLTWPHTPECETQRAKS